MMLPPSIVRIRIVEKGQKKLSIWIPLFLLWPLMLVLLLIAAPLIILGLLLAAVLHPKHPVRHYLCAVPWLVGVLFSLRGLSVSVKEPNEEFYIAIW